MRFFGWDQLGFLPHNSWGGGPDSDGTDLFGESLRGVDRHGDCYDPTVRRQPARDYYERGCTDGAFHLPPRGKPGRKHQLETLSPKCPGHNGHDMHRVAAALGAEVVNLGGSSVLRRKRAVA